MAIAIGSPDIFVRDVVAADLQPWTTVAFDRYVRLTEVRMDDERLGRIPFLWVDRLPDGPRREVDARLRRGEIVIDRLETRDATGRIDCPDGMRHHWVGTAFASGAHLEQPVTLMQGYDRYHEIYRPNVRRAKLLSRDGNRFEVSVQLFMKKVISVVLNSEYDVTYVPISPTRMQVRSASTRIAEVEGPDSPGEREKPVGHDNGFLWRFNNYCALEERDGGTYIQCESVSLSRQIPFALRWLIGPFVTGIPRESLEFTLGMMRGALANPRAVQSPRTPLSSWPVR